MNTKELRQNIVNHLSKKGNYECTVDDYVLDMLIENILYAEEAKRDLDEHGIVQNIEARNGVFYTKANPAFSVYQMCLRNINQLSVKLGINRADRIKLKLLAEKLEDDFTNDFD